MRTGKKADHRRDRNRALWTSAALLLVCSLSLYMASNVGKSSDEMRAASRPGFGTGHGASASGASGESDDVYLATGSILFVPKAGNICRKRLIDNKTWFMRDKGYVVCDEAVSWNANITSQRYTPTTRVDAIRGGFFRK